MTWVAVALLGGVGAVGRFVAEAAVSRRLKGFPWGTLAVNVSGSFGLGLLAGAGVHGDALLIAGTALLGSYTTFSAWMLETERLGEAVRLRAAAANVVVSFALGLGAAELGRLLL